MAPPLTLATLDAVPDGIARPDYDPSAVTVGIVHFGPGAFHRAHAACYVDRLLAHDPRWGIAAVSMRSRDTIDALITAADRRMYLNKSSRRAIGDISSYSASS